MSLNSVSVSIIVFIFFTSAYSYAASSFCIDVYKKKPSLKLKFDSSVEVEIDPSPAIIDLFTTKDGTIAPVLGRNRIDVIPDTILKSLQEYVGEEGDVRSVPWDALTTGEKIELIAAASKGNNFHASRTIPGLIYRKEISITFSKPTHFIGKDFKPGNHKFMSNEIFGNTAIEYMGPNRMNENLGFELHVRSGLSAGENLKTARVIQSTLSGGPVNVHLHMVGPVVDVKTPTRWQRVVHYFSQRHRNNFNRINASEVFKLADLARRTMLYFDIQMIERGIPMTSVLSRDADSINFYPVDYHKFINFTRSLLNGKQGGGVQSKSGTVGLRTSHYYDQSGIWGMEVRYLSPFLDQKITAEALDIFQRRIISGNYFLSSGQAIDYLKKYKDDFDYSIQNLLYVSDFNVNLYFRNFNDAQIEFVLNEVQKNDFLKMLFHDWSNDPIYVQNKERLKKILDAQNYSLALLFGGMPSVEVMKIFIKKSALSYDLKNSVFN